MTQRLCAIVVLLAGCVVGEHGATEDLRGDSPRTLDGLQVEYRFREGKGLAVHDTSGVQPAFDLELDNLITNQWVPDGGIRITGPSVITSPDVAEKVFVACVRANAVSLEAWVEPASITQAGTIFTYSTEGDRNATLAVNLLRYRGAVRTSDPDPLNMTGRIETIQTKDGITAAKLQHVVYTRDQSGATIYVDGAVALPTPQTPPTMPPPVTDQNVWTPAAQLAFGADPGGGAPWLGTIYLAAVYCKKLGPAEVQQNYAVGYAF
jgi:hypothetical protein